MIETRVKPAMSEKQKNAVFESLWLTYFNDTLYTKGVITEDERNKMRIMIKRRADERSQ